MSNFWGPFIYGQKINLKCFWKHYSVSTEKLHNTFFMKIFFKKFFVLKKFLTPKKWKSQFSLGLKIWV